MVGGAEGAIASNFFKIVGLSETLMLCWTISGLLLLVKINAFIKIRNFFGNSSSFAPYFTGVTTPLHCLPIPRTNIEV